MHTAISLLQLPPAARAIDPVLAGVLLGAEIAVLVGLYLGIRRRERRARREWERSKGRPDA